MEIKYNMNVVYLYIVKQFRKYNTFTFRIKLMSMEMQLLFKKTFLAYLHGFKNPQHSEIWQKRKKLCDFTKGHAITVLFYEAILHCNQLEEFAGLTLCVFL